MSDPIGYEQFVQMVRGAAEQVRANHEILTKLDSVGGDGDHGTTMVRAMANAEKAIEGAPPGELKSLLGDIGWAIMGTDGGATGPLLGTLFMGMADAVGDKETLDADGLAAAFEAGLAAVQKQTRAKVGDKTIMDALVPGVEALRKGADAGEGVAAALKAAAAAAEQGADSTRELQARFGRATNLKEGRIGSQDPGATSISLIFRGFAQSCQ
jgi:dihydroxyacetone kinase-like protein